MIFREFYGIIQEKRLKYVEDWIEYGCIRRLMDMGWIESTYRVVLFGHRDFNGHRALDARLYPLLCDLIRTKPFVEIYIGRNGEFDIYAATVVKRVQNAMGKANNEFICVLPYPEKDMEYYEEYYDNVMIPECIGRTHPKGAITKRNTISDDELSKILLVLNIEYEQKIRFSDGTSIEMKTD